LDSKSSEFDSNSREKSDLSSRCSDLRQKLDSFEETKNSLEVENGSLKRERDQLSAERNDLFELAERRQQEVERLHAEWQTLSKQLGEANEEKCRALVASEDVKSKEVSLQYRERRMEEEREYLNSQVRTLTEELTRKNEESMGVRREAITKSSQLRERMEETAEKLRMAESRETAKTEDLRQMESRAEDLSEKLRTARNSEIHLEENYRQELMAQTRLADLYKGHCDESENKATELSNAVTELQSMLKESANRYGALENSLDAERSEKREEMKKRNEAIKGLRKELDAANDLINTMKKKGLTEDDVERLSPSAAAASRLLKGGITLTQIYSQLVSSQEELLSQKDENGRLNTYLDQILEEIESRAPGLKRQREDYDRAVAAVESLTRQLDEARQEFDFRRREADDVRQKNGSLARENQRLLMQVQDTGKQVTTLIMEVEASRSGMLSRTSRNDSGVMNRSMDADGVITDRLLGFRDVEELQKKNIELLAVVRELSSNNESVESRLVEEKTAELKKELESAAQQVEELRAARRRQEVMVESIIIERDMYKSITHNADADQQQQRMPSATSTPTVSGAPAAKMMTPSPRAKTSSYQELEKKATGAQAVLEEVKKEFDIYRTDKCENERILNEELKITREALNEARSKSIKLASQEEYNTERFKIAQTNAASFRKQCQILEDRNAKLNGIVSKHEQSSETIRTEVMHAQSKLSQAEVQLEFLRHEKSILKNAETRMLQENEILRRQKNSSDIVLENLNLIKLNLERAEGDKVMRLQNRSDTLDKEVSLLRKKAEAEREEQGVAVKAWETAQKDVSAKLEEANTLKKELEDKLNSVTLEKDEFNNKLSETSEKLVLAETTLSSRGVTAIQRQESQTEASAKYRDLQMQLNQSRNESNSVKQQMATTKHASLQYKEIADSAEKRLAENNNAAKALKEDLETRLKLALEEKVQIEQKLVEMQEANMSAPVSCEAQLKESLALTQQNLQSVTEQLANAQRVEAESRAETESQMLMASEAHQKYQNEIVLHAHDVGALNALKASSVSHKSQVEELEEARKNADVAVAEVKANMGSVEQTMRAEYCKLKEQFGVVEKENGALHSQLGTVTSQMTSLQKHFEGNPDAGKSFSEEESRSAEQLMEIIKFLRREKEILTSKVEVLQAEAVRVRSQLDHMQNEADEAKGALSAEREKSDSTAMSSTKHAELLEKVQTVSALNDSNKMLREERDHFMKSLNAQADCLSASEAKLKPCQARISALEQIEEELKVESVVLKADNNRWKTRANQLVEKHQKINPEEMKRLQIDNSNLTKQISAMQMQIRQSQTNNVNLTARAKSMQDSGAKTAIDMRQKTAEVNRLMLELKKAATLSQQANLRVNQINAKVAELEEAKKILLAEKEVASRTSAELSMVKKNLEASSESVKKFTTIVEDLKRKTAIQVKTNNQLRTMAKSFKEKIVECEKEKLEFQEEKKKLEAEKTTAVEAAAASVPAEAGMSAAAESEKDKEIAELTAKLGTADEIVESLNKQVEELGGESAASPDTRVTELESELEEAKAEMEKEKSKSERSMRVLRGGKEKMVTLVKSNEVLKKELAELKASGGSGGEPSKPSAAEKAKAAELEQKLQTLQSELDEATAERDRLQTQIDSKQEMAPTPTPATETVTASVKPMATPQQPAPRKATAAVHHQPQAHIHPTRHMPATATIRPQTQNRPAVVGIRPTIVSVSPNSASQTTAAAAAASASSPATSALNPAATEFAPRSQQQQQQPVPVAAAAPRQQQDSDSDSAAVAGPSRGTAAPMAQKRRREEEEAQQGEESKKQKTVPPATATVTSVSVATSEDTQEEVETPALFEEAAPAVVVAAAAAISASAATSEDTQEEVETPMMFEEAAPIAAVAAAAPDDDDVVAILSSGDEADEADDQPAAVEEAVSSEEDCEDIEEEEEEDGGNDEDMDAENDEDDDVVEIIDEPEEIEVAQVEDEEEEQAGGAEEVYDLDEPGEEVDEGGEDASAAPHPSAPDHSDAGAGPSSGMIDTVAYHRQPSIVRESTLNLNSWNSFPHAINYFQPFEDLGDSVVPGTPKLPTPRGASPLQPAQSMSEFVFDSSAAPEGAAAELASQEGADKTAVDFAQFSTDDAAMAAEEGQ
jgi:nucleoprotein TPR